MRFLPTKRQRQAWSANHPFVASVLVGAGFGLWMFFVVRFWEAPSSSSRWIVAVAAFLFMFSFSFLLLRRTGSRRHD